MNARHGNRKLLRDLLIVLIKEYGVSEVEFTLDEILGIDRKTLRSRSARRVEAPTAVSLVKADDISDRRRDRLMSLAEKFDAKLFLPSLNDVRNFVEIRDNSIEIHKRPGSFRYILPLLKNMSEEELLSVERNAQNSGPAQLGPLSDAIRTRSEEIMRLKEENKNK